MWAGRVNTSVESLCVWNKDLEEGALGTEDHWRATGGIPEMREPERACQWIEE